MGKIDTDIQIIQEELENDYEWNRTLSELSRYNLTNSTLNAQRLLEFFAYHYDSESKFETQISFDMWQRLVFSVGDILNIFDKSGISKYILKYQDQIIKNDFSISSDFKNLEERMLSNLKIPEKAWKKFWDISEESKITSIERLYSEKQPRISNIWNEKYQYSIGPGKVKPLSPFKWGRAVATGLSSTLLFVNGALMLTSGGIGIASVMAPILVLSYYSGRNST